MQKNRRRESAPDLRSFGGAARGNHQGGGSHRRYHGQGKNITFPTHRHEASDKNHQAMQKDRCPRGHWPAPELQAGVAWSAAPARQEQPDHQTHSDDGRCAHPGVGTQTPGRCLGQAQRNASAFPKSSWSKADGQKQDLQPARAGGAVHRQGQGAQEIRVRPQGFPGHDQDHRCHRRGVVVCGKHL
ncbi:hypothetical protein DesfrDRAFT_2519 [Solidesulfovibrio fructosivorans JJ]]|uniref:Uncharacterized protein n=1 Tax=Solidesulfovibrio fructosivorans JJ] TaxID=596151 RepID=E1JY20_SOLFR|nr:hypothetical protein DesfrDRAFT_2519 [Solidesulfovibrio fructosivorans JJ]]